MNNVTNYTITTAKGDKIVLNNSRVHELKGKLRELRLAHKEVVSLQIEKMVLQS